MNELFENRIKTHSLFLLISFIFLNLSILCLVPEAYAGRTGNLIGRVTDQKTGEPVINGKVAGVNQQWDWKTDYDGKYFLLNILPGIYEIEVSHIEFHTNVISEVTIIRDSTTVVDIELLPRHPERVSISTPPHNINRLLKTGLFTGKVTDKITGEPVSNANVQIIDLNSLVTTDTSGFFRTNFIVSGIYNIQISCVGYRIKILKDFNIKALVTTELKIELEREETEPE